MFRFVALVLLAAIAFAPAARADIIGMQVKRAVTEDEMKASLRAIDLVDESGARLDLAALLGNGKRTLVTLWANWCPNCRAEIPGFKKIAAACPDKWNIVFVSARAGDYAKDLAKFKSYALPWKIHNVARMAKPQVANAFYGATAEGGVVTPLHYFLTKSGQVEMIVNAKMDFEDPQRLAVVCGD